jgi:hypothetical protein
MRSVDSQITQPGASLMKARASRECACASARTLRSSLFGTEAARRRVVCRARAAKLCDGVRSGVYERGFSFFSR